MTTTKYAEEAAGAEKRDTQISQVADKGMNFEKSDVRLAEQVRDLAEAILEIRGEKKKGASEVRMDFKGTATSADWWIIVSRSRSGAVKITSDFNNENWWDSGYHLVSSTILETRPDKTVKTFKWNDDLLMLPKEYEKMTKEDATRSILFSGVLSEAVKKHEDQKNKAMDLIRKDSEV